MPQSSIGCPVLLDFYSVLHRLLRFSLDLVVTIEWTRMTNTGDDGFGMLLGNKFNTLIVEVITVKIEFLGMPNA